MPQPFDLKSREPNVRPKGALGATSLRSKPGLVWLLAIAAALAGALLPTPWWQLAIVAATVLVCAAAGRLTAPAFRFGIWAALLFIALRVAYRVVFTTTALPPAGAILLLDLPVLPLGGPLRGIALFGPLTLDAVLATLSDASRFAVVFIVFGAANALADARTLLARAPRSLLPIATVLSLALGTVPALLAAAQRVSFAASLRGERRSPRLLVPVFEQSVERATALGASMELRGFGSRSRSAEPHHHRDSPPPGSALLRASGVSVRHGSRPTLIDVDIELRSGQLTIITGPTGSGKSTLLSVLAGLAPAYTRAEVEGALSIRGAAPEPVSDLRPARMSGAVALVPQRVEHSFLADTVRRELAFAPSRLGKSGAELEAIVGRGLERFGLLELAERDPASLSAGEATRVALAAAAITEPSVLLLDEPIADLDPESMQAVLGALQGLLAQGCAVLVAEHRPEALRMLDDDREVQWLQLRGGRLETDSVLAPAAPSRPAPSQGSDRGAPQPAIVLAQSVQIERGGRELLRIDELAVRPGEVAVLSGANGAGKTSLFEDLALRAPSQRELALVPHRVDDLLIRDTLSDECRFADRRTGATRGATLARFERLIAGSIIDTRQLATTHPRDLSAGTRLVLAIAVQLAHTPRVLLLDEPTRGLDADTRRRVAELLTRLAAEGRAVLIATHDEAFSNLLAAAGASTRHLRISDGRLT